MNISILGFIIYTIIIIALACYTFKCIISYKQADKVNHPPHYQKNGKECIEVMEEQFGPKAVYWFCILNAFKYKWRAGVKEGNSYEQDMAKAQWYLEYGKNLNNKHNNQLTNISSD